MNELLDLYEGGEDRRLLAAERFDALPKELTWYREQFGHCERARLEEATERGAKFELDCDGGSLGVWIFMGRNNKIRFVSMFGAKEARREVVAIADRVVQLTTLADPSESFAAIVGDDPSEEQRNELAKLMTHEECTLQRFRSGNYHLSFFVMACEEGGAILGVYGGGERKSAFSVFDEGANAWWHWVPAWADPG